jgi:hypothetical protein
MVWRQTVRPLLGLLIAGCLSQPIAGATPASGPASQIETIIYSSLSDKAMLAHLQPYIRIGEKFSVFTNSTKLSPSFCFGTGPGAQICMFPFGLTIAVDPDGFIRILQRDARTIDGRAYSKMCIGPCSLSWHGYVLGLGNDS